MLTELSWFSLCFMCHFYLAARFGLSAPGMEWGSVKEGGGGDNMSEARFFFLGGGSAVHARPGHLRCVVLARGKKRGPRWWRYFLCGRC